MASSRRLLRGLTIRGSCQDIQAAGLAGLAGLAESAAHLELVEVPEPVQVQAEVLVEPELPEELEVLEELVEQRGERALQLQLLFPSLSCLRTIHMFLLLRHFLSSFLLEPGRSADRQFQGNNTGS